MIIIMARKGSPMKTVAELIDELFKTHTNPDGRELSYQEVARMTGNQLNPTHISKMRNGNIPNPTRNSLLLLCQVFNVPAAYFFPELERTSPSEGDTETEKVFARRAAQLPKEAQVHLSAFLEILEKSRKR